MIIIVYADHKEEAVACVATAAAIEGATGQKAYMGKLYKEESDGGVEENRGDPGQGEEDEDGGSMADDDESLVRHAASRSPCLSEEEREELWLIDCSATS